MKKFTTLFVLLIFAFSIFTTNVGAFNIDTEFDTNDLTNQWEFVYEELSEIQEEPNAYCENLKTINFEGTQAQWDAIEKDSQWAYEAADYNVICGNE